MFLCLFRCCVVFLFFFWCWFPLLVTSFFVVVVVLSSAFCVYLFSIFFVRYYAFYHVSVPLITSSGVLLIAPALCLFLYCALSFLYIRLCEDFRRLVDICFSTLFCIFLIGIVSTVHVYYWYFVSMSLFLPSSHYPSPPLSLSRFLCHCVCVSSAVVVLYFCIDQVFTSLSNAVSPLSNRIFNFASFGWLLEMFLNSYYNALSSMSLSLWFRVCICVRTISTHSWLRMFIAYCFCLYVCFLPIFRCYCPG